MAVKRTSVYSTVPDEELTEEELKIRETNRKISATLKRKIADGTIVAPKPPSTMIEQHPQEMLLKSANVIIERELHPKIKSNFEAVEPSDGVARKILGIMQYALELSKTINRKEPQTMMDALANFVSFCCESDAKVTNQMCCLACGVTDKDIRDWACGLKNVDDPRYKEFAMTLRKICASFREQLAADSKLNPVLAIWWQKVYEGYREDNNQGEAVSDDKRLTAEEIKEKYKDMPD